MIHFLLPFILAIIIIIHLIFLHKIGSSKPLGNKINTEKILFQPFFTIKDLNRIALLIILLLYFSLINPFIIGDPENFNPANPLNTPIHIQPE